ncbi:coatomer subunit beta [Elasticomyces elasticus]|nr:coatomer subunit beta [Elasticomyces elasticus]
MATFLDQAYSLVHLDNSADQPSLQEIRTQLEKGTDETKQETMKRVLTVMLNGDPMPQLLMHIIRFVMPSKSKALKKLLYLYYEICPKLDANGKLKQEMILVWYSKLPNTIWRDNGIRMDLQHANEYIRGNTLRFLTKLHEPELIEPLLAPARACLEHRHAYVRKNAVFAIASIYQHSEALMPDAPELIQAFLEAESDHTCKRNAFAALLSISHDKAAEYLNGVFEGIPNADELLQLVELEFIRKDAVTNSQNKARYLRLIFDLLEAKESTVVYEAASSLTALTNNAVAVKAAAAKFIELSIKESDNNVKLIVLEKVNQLRQRNVGVLDDLTMEILRVLSSPDLDVRRKALNLAMDMVSSKNVEEVILLLKKELSKTVDEQYEKNNEYRSLLIHAIHQCAIEFSEVASGVVDLLMDSIAEFNNASAVDVISFVKEVVEKFPKLRQKIVERLVKTLSEVRAGKVYRGALWIVGEYSLEVDDIREAWKRIRASVGEIPIVASEQKLLEEQPDGESDLRDQMNGHAKTSAPTGSRRVLADGTYATESALTSQSAVKAKLEAVKAAQKPPLRQLILDGDYYLATVLSSTLTKLVMRHAEISHDTARTNSLRAEAMLIMISIIRAGQSQFVKAPIDEDSVDRIMSCVRSLASFTENKQLGNAFLDDTREAFRAMVAVTEKERAEKDAVAKARTAIQVDDVFSIRQLKKANTVDGADEIEIDLEKATGGDSATEDLSSKLSRVVQLTGFSDPVYCEAYVRVHQFDIMLDVLLVNQTQETLQNLSVEFATLGDLKVVERPTTQNLAPLDFLNVQATIKVSSTDTGVIFGNVVYDGSSSTDSSVVILNDIHVDIMDYIQPAQCTETQFRTMWTEFEWENKVNINSKMPAGKNLRDFLASLMKTANMSCLTPEASIEGDCNFLSANLYARSVFGEDALANLSVEQDGESGIVSGFVRIRSRSQGLALSLGSLKGLSKVGEKV